MRNIITLFFLAQTPILFSQTTTPIKLLEVNNVRAMVSSRGQISHNFATGQASYEIPKGAGTHTVFELSPIWSVNINGNIKCAYNPYNLTGNMLGPVSNQYGSSWHQDTRAIFSVNEQIANDHMNNWNQSGYVTPQSILDWPGNGLPSEGTDLYLAPFEDVDGNLEYNPNDGDYPIVKGDDNAYSIYSYDSVYNTLGDSFVEEYPIEIRQMTYQYATSDDLNNTTFIKYTVVNRGNETLEDFKFGLYVDFDLGGPQDDYIGTDSTRNMFYVYNADNNDENEGGINGYNNNPPAFGVKILNDNLHATASVDNTDPRTQINYPSALYYIMNGYYVDSSPFMNSNNEQIRLMFKGDPNVSGSESEIELSNVPGDRRTILSITPIDLEPNESVCYEIALVYGQGTDNLNSVAELQSAADEIQTFYDNGQNSCWTPPAFLSVEEKEENQIEAKIYPNPFENIFTIENATTIENIEIININGQTVKTMQPNQNLTQINTSDLAPGMYFVKLRDERNNLKTYRVIKR